MLETLPIVLLILLWLLGGAIVVNLGFNLYTSSILVLAIIVTAFYAIEVKYL